MTSNGMELNFVLLFNAFGGCLRFAVPIGCFCSHDRGRSHQNIGGNHRAGIVVCRRSHIALDTVVRLSGIYFPAASVLHSLLLFLFY